MQACAKTTTSRSPSTRRTSRSRTKSGRRCGIVRIRRPRSYADAQRTRITLGVTPVTGAKNVITTADIKRGARSVKPATQSLDDGGGQFIFEVSAFAATEPIAIELVGRARTLTCSIDQAVLAKFR